MKHWEVDQPAALFHFADGGLGGYFAVIGEVVGDAMRVLEGFELVEVLAEGLGGALLLSRRERTTSLAQGVAIEGAGSGDTSGDRQCLAREPGSFAAKHRARPV